MRVLLIVGSANDIFIYNYAKWLKSSIDINIDVFEFYPSAAQGFNSEYFNNVTSPKESYSFYGARYISPFFLAKNLKRFIKGKQYDIIHCHRIVPPVVLVNNLKSYCKKLVITLWGGELDNLSILGSKKLYRCRLNSFAKKVDAIINGSAAEELLKINLPSFKGLYYSASFGSSPIESLYNLMLKVSRQESKEFLGLPTEKYSVLVGYSGKELHRHIPIIEELAKRDDLKSKIHLLLPMTRGAGETYVKSVREAVEKSGYTFTMFSGRFYDDREVAHIRNATDLVLQLSLYDGFSRSIIECFYAKSLVIYGDWLGYEPSLKLDGFKGISVKSISEAVSRVSDILREIDSFSDILELNHINGGKKYFWSECIKDWVRAYRNLLS